MENTQLLLGALQPVLGKGKHTSKENYAFFCPFCHHKKRKLEVNLLTDEKGNNHWHCWTCDKKGKTLITLLKALQASKEKIDEVKGILGIKTGDNQGKTAYKPVTLPAEFIPLSENNGTFMYKKALKYLKERGFGMNEVYTYNLGYCEKGKYANKVIIPSYDSNGTLNYFVARSFEKDPIRKYDAPACDKNNIIGFENLINWKVPVILCEGAFDAIAIKRNAIPLFGKTLPKALLTKLISPNVKTIYLALDSDIWGSKNTIQFAEQFINLGKEVYIVDLQEKDPADLGFQNILPLLHSATPLTFADIISRKLKLV